jgi:hypothetical protein
MYSLELTWEHSLKNLATFLKKATSMSKHALARQAHKITKAAFLIYDLRCNYCCYSSALQSNS